MARPPADTVQVTFRIPSHWLKEADAVAALLTHHGMPATRTDAFREAIARGLREIARDIEGPNYRVSAWDGMSTTCLFWAGRDEHEALEEADKAAKENRGGRWTVFRVYQGDEEIYSVRPGKTVADGVKNRAAARAEYEDAKAKASK